MFVHDPIQLLALFKREPIISNEFGLNYSYALDDERHSIVFGFNADTSDCSVVVSARGSGDPVASFVYLSSPGARVVSDRRGEFLEVAAPGGAVGSTMETFAPHRGLRIWLRPTIRVEGFGDA